MAWQSYDDKMSLREMAGIRGISPSVRFKYEIPGYNQDQIVYHITSNSKIYIWGVELYSEGYDCLEIYKINDDGSSFSVKNGGFLSEDIVDKKFITYNNDEVSVLEYPGFDDFWNDSYLIKNNYTTIVKGNFFRCFEFKSNGIYKIVLNEYHNPSYSSNNFSPIDYTSNESFKGAFTIYGGVTSNEDLGYLEGEFRRELIIKVISKDKDIVKEKDLNFIELILPNGYVELSSYDYYKNYSINSFKENNSYSISGNFSYLHKNSFSYNNDNYYIFNVTKKNNSIFLNDLSEFENNYNSIYTKSINNPPFIYGTKTLYLRNLSISNIVFSSKVHHSKNIFVTESLDLNSDLIDLNEGYGPVYDLRGSIFRNCVFKDECISLLSMQNLDGVTFESCVFENCSMSKLRSSGMLFKNCKWNGRCKLDSDEELSWCCGDSNCIMGCEFKNINKAFVCKLWQPFTNNIFIRNFCHGLDVNSMHGNVGTAEPISDSLSSSATRFYCNNMNIMNSYTRCNINFMSIYGISAKLNLSAFNFADSINSDELFADSSVTDSQYIMFNISLHNGCNSGGGVYLSGNAHKNRWIDIVWGNPSFKESLYKERDGEFHYQQSPFFEVLSQEAQIPIKNLISNCAIVNYQEYDNFYGNNLLSDPAINRDKNFTNINLDNDISELNNGVNLIYNLRKIVRQYY